jgi:hypothetical protein
MGLITVAREKEKISFDGDPEIARTEQEWLGLSPFAVEKKRMS